MIHKSLVYRRATRKRRVPLHGARDLVHGLTFRQNMPDLRNTRIEERAESAITADVHDLKYVLDRADSDLRL